MDARVRRAIEILVLVSEKAARRPTIATLGAEVNLSSSRLRHLFRAETGLSMRRYWKVQRLRRARGLLETTFLTVKEIAVATGSGDESHFVRDFKALFGLTPRRYREIAQADVVRDRATGRPAKRTPNVGSSRLRRMD